MERPDPDEVRSTLRERTDFKEETIDEVLEGLTDEEGRLPPKLPPNPVQLAKEMLAPKSERPRERGSK